MSRIATLTAVLTMLVAPAAFAGQDLRSPDARDVVARTAVTKVDLRSPDAATPVQAAGQDLRSPDARDPFSPSARDVVAPSADPTSSGVSAWTLVAIIAGALAACAALAVMLRRQLRVGGPVGV